MSQKLPESDDDFNTFSSVAPDLKRGEPRKIEEELYKKNWQKTAVDTFETRLGISVPGVKKDKKNVAIKNKTFQMEYDKDATLLNELMNSPKYRIVYWKDNWTMEGNYRIFCIYEDDLDYKPEKK